MTRRKALITGIGGQDGSYLAEYLIRRGVDVLGVERPGGVADYPNLAAVADKVSMVSVEVPMTRAHTMRERKGADPIVLNDFSDLIRGFDSNDNTV